MFQANPRVECRLPRTYGPIPEDCEKTEGIIQIAADCR